MSCSDLTMQIKYGLAYCGTCPSVSTDPGSLNPGTRRSRVPGWWDPGIRTNTGGKWHSFSLAFCVRRRWRVAAESRELWSGALHTTLHYYNYQYFNDTSRHDGYKNGIQQVMLVLSSLFPINYSCYKYTAVGTYCTVCVQMLDGAKWHEAPWKLGLFTFWCEVDTAFSLL